MLTRKWKNSFSKKKLNEQLRFFFTLVISVLMIATLVVFTFSTIRSSYRRSKAEAEAQVNVLASSYASWLNNIDNLILSLIMENETQEFCLTTESSGDIYQNLYSELSEYLNRYQYVNSDVNSIAVINTGTGNYVYSGIGGTGVNSINFDNYYKESINSAKNAKIQGSLKFDYGYEYTNGESFTLSFYRPVYSTTEVGALLGLACVNLSDSILTDSISENMEICLTDSKGAVILSTDSTRMEKQESILDFQSQKAGSVFQGGYCYVYQQISGWNFYVVSIVPLEYFYQSSINTAIFIILLTIALLFAGLSAMRWIMDKSYEPLQQVLTAMDNATQNQLDTRINTNDMGADFEKLGSGFNHMMDEVQDLMNRLLKEQHQADQIRFNALQSQIQPHFLYNTLDTIHWQAKMDGKQEMSDLVMVLAKYYRICLSKGKDIIPLSTEMEQISYYLQIQNTRYGDIISYRTDVPEEFYLVRIPKLTLQPLVENSIYHGIRVKEGFKGTVCIKARRAEDGILIQVADCGIGMNEDQIRELNQSIQNFGEEVGYGVRNVNRRIQLLFGESYGLFYHANPEGGIIVDILLPEEYDEGTGDIENV
ncbi:MAG: sensor histidine kinase [Clostridiales bacterium]|nr:sensor histidine kinase [Clostridiales bacterium]